MTFCATEAGREPGPSWPLPSNGGIRIRLRSVISRHNLFIYESWLAWLDVALEPSRRKLGFTFDTIIAPEELADEGGEFPRAGLRGL